MDQDEAEVRQQPLVVVNVVIFTLRENDLQVFLVKRRRSPQEGKWAIPGGAVGLHEGLESAALRTLAEHQHGLADVYLEQLYTFGETSRDPHDRVIAVAYLAVVPPPDSKVRAADEALHARWWSIYDLPDLALDYGDILSYALTRLRYKLEYTAVGFELLPEEFTLSELQTAYEIVLGEALDKRNFRRKILCSGIIEPGSHYRSGEGRPARLYHYREDAVAEVKARRLFP